MRFNFEKERFKPNFSVGRNEGGKEGGREGGRDGPFVRGVDWLGGIDLMQGECSKGREKRFKRKGEREELEGRGVGREGGREGGRKGRAHLHEGSGFEWQGQGVKRHCGQAC